MQFLKEHLAGCNYTWATETDTSRKPDRRVFNRLNGDQLLCMINSFSDSIGKLSMDDALRIECLLTRELPEDVKSEISVFNWLRSKYLYYWN